MHPARQRARRQTHRSPRASRLTSGSTCSPVLGVKGSPVQIRPSRPLLSRSDATSPGRRGASRSFDRTLTAGFGGILRHVAFINVVSVTSWQSGNEQMAPTRGATRRRGIGGRRMTRCAATGTSRMAPGSAACRDRHSHRRGRCVLLVGPAREGTCRCATLAWHARNTCAASRRSRGDETGRWSAGAVGDLCGLGGDRLTRVAWSDRLGLACRLSSPVPRGPLEAVCKFGAGALCRVPPVAAACACVSLLY